MRTFVKYLSVVLGYINVGIVGLGFYYGAVDVVVTASLAAGACFVPFALI